MSLSILKKAAAKARGEKGFTLMELLIVIVILGFLVGMLAPRLAGFIGDDVIDSICDTNNKGARQYIAMFHQQNGRLPNDVINLVNETAADDYDIPATSNEDPADGPEPFAVEFQERNDLRTHVLNEAEAEALQGLGIVQVRNLNLASDGQAVVGPALERIDIAEGVTVAMVGMGAATAAAVDIDVDWSGWDDASDATVPFPKGNPYWLGRIVFGLGAHSELVTSGIVANAALCPGGMQASDNVSFNNYCLIVPRLAETVARLIAGDQDAEVTIYAADDNGVATAGDGGQVDYFDLSGQEDWHFDATCPEGHKWPDNDNDFWVFVQG